MRAVFYFTCAVIWRPVQIIWEGFWRVLLFPISLILSIALDSNSNFDVAEWAAFPEQANDNWVCTYFLCRHKLRQFFCRSWVQARERATMEADVKTGRDDNTLLRPFERDSR